MYYLVPDDKQISKQLKHLALLSGHEHYRAEMANGSQWNCQVPGLLRLLGAWAAMSWKVLVLHPDTKGKEAALSYQQLLEYLSSWLEGKMS